MRKAPRFALAGAALALAAGGLVAVQADEGDEDPHAGWGAAEELAHLLRDNADFVGAHEEGYFETFESHQHPKATLITCSDSRVHMHAFDHEPDDDLFVIRNIGNQVDITPGSIAYGIVHLETPLLLIVGHVHCGAVKAALGDYSSEPPAIRRELDGLHLALRGDTEGTFDERWLRGVVSNVRQQVRFAVAEYPERVAAGDLAVVGTVYDFADELGEGRGRLVVVDINGVDPEDSPLMADVEAILEDG